MEDSVNLESEIGKEILREVRNFSKDGAERKTTKEYFERKISIVEPMFREFSQISEEINRENPNRDTSFCDTVNDAYTQYSSTLHESLQQFQEPVLHNLENGDNDSVAKDTPSTSTSNLHAKSPFKSSYANRLHTENISQFIDSKQQQLKIKLKLTDDKLEEVIAERDQLSVERDNLSAEITGLKKQKNALMDENIRLKNDNSKIDSLLLEKDELKMQYQALKNNFLRVTHEKNRLSNAFNVRNSSPTRDIENVHYSHSNSRRHSQSNSQTGTDSEDELFSIKEIIKLIPKFNGNSNDLRVYINKCNELWSFVKKPMDRTRFITVLKNNLSGDAALVLLDEDGLDNWDSIRDVLQSNFNAEPNHSNHIAMLQSMKQRKDETVSDFCKRIKELLNKLKSSIPNGTTKQFWFEHNEKQAIQALEDGLADVKLQSRVVSASKPTFNIASQFAIETDNRLKSKIISDRSDSKGSLLCKYCKSNDHMIENCKKRPAKDQKKPQSATTNEKKSDDFRCTICSTNTHTTEICYKNPKNKNNGKSDKSAGATANSLSNNHSEINNCDISNSSEYQIWIDSEN